MSTAICVISPGAVCRVRKGDMALGSVVRGMSVLLFPELAMRGCCALLMDVVSASLGL